MVASAACAARFPSCLLHLGNADPDATAYRGDLVKRRDFIAGLGSAAAAWPLAARAQQPVIPVIGFLGSRASGEDPQLLTAFRLGLKEAGYVEGQNLKIEFRFAENRYDRLPALATDLVQHQVPA
jgi:putative ABC transport system substrate-binding protein